MRRIPSALILGLAMPLLGGCDALDLQKVMPDSDKDRYFDSELPEDTSHHSFGEQFYWVLYHDIEDDLPDGEIDPRDPLDLRRIAEYRTAKQESFSVLEDDLIAAADAVAGGSLLEPLDEPAARGCRETESALECSLRSMLDKIDDGTLPRLTRVSARILRDLLDRERPDEEDRVPAPDDDGDGVPDWIDALVYLSETNLLYSRQETVELAHQYFAYAEVWEFVHELARMARGLDVDGLPNQTAHVLPELLEALAEEAKTIDVEGTVRAIDVDLLERVLGVVAEPDEGVPAWVVRADDHGNPKVARDDFGGLHPPFRDDDGDGCADVDLEGRPLDERDDPIVIPPFAQPGDGETPRDSEGRALTRAGGDTLYEYVDFKETVFGSAVRTLRLMVDAKTTEMSDFDWLVDWVAELLGYPEAPSVLASGERFSAGRFPFLDEGVDLAYALVAAQRLERPDRLTAGLAAVMADDCVVARPGGDEIACAGALAEAVAVLVDAADDLDASGASLTPHSTMADELMPFLHDLRDPELAGRAPGEPGLLADLLASQADPAIAELGPSFARMMRYRDKDLTRPVDPASYRADAGPDGYGDRSSYQRFMHLIQDTNGAPYAPDLSFFPGLPEFTIPNMATFYMDALACNATVPLIFKTVVNSLQDDTLNECAYKNPADPPNDPEFPMHISSRQLNRFMNADNFFGNALGLSGNELKDFNGDTLFAFENSGADMGFKPIAQVFSDTGNSQLLADLLWVIHAHYSKHNPAPPNPGHPFAGTQVVAHLRAYEPTLADLLDAEAGGGRDFLGRLHLLTKVAAGAESGDERVLLDEVTAMAAHLLDPQKFVSDRDAGRPGDLRPGAPEPLALDGVSSLPAEEVTHLHAILDALDRFDAAYDEADPVVGDRFEDITDLLIDRFLLEGWETEAGGRIVGDLVLTVLGPSAELIAEEAALRVADERFESDLDGELIDLHEAEQDLVEAIEGKALAAGLRFVVQARRDSQLRNLFRRWSNYLMEPTATGAEPFFARDPYTNLSRLVTALLQLKASGQSRDAISTSLDLSGDLLAGYSDELLQVLDDLDESIEDNSVLVDDRGLKDRETLFVALRNVFAPEDGSLNEYPFETLGRAMTILGRVEPIEGEGELDAHDMHRILLKALEQLEDEQHGIERLYSIVCARKRTDSESGEDPCTEWLESP